MILGRYLLTALVLYFKIYKHVTTGGDRPFEGCTAHMLDFSTYDYNSLNI